MFVTIVEGVEFLSKKEHSVAMPVYAGPNRNKALIAAKDARRWINDESVVTVWQMVDGTNTPIYSSAW